MAKNNTDSMRELRRTFVDPYRVTHGAKFRLKDFDPSDTGSLKSEDRPRAKEALAAGKLALAELQDKLYANDRWSMLLIVQAMDAAGKDSAIKHVMSGVNPQGCQVYSFKQPSAEELDHDWMWRAWRALPERGRIGIFNRSYYEEVLIVKVHPEILASQRLPPALVGRSIWDERYEDIRAFERHLARNGTVIVKFFLYVSRDEQRKRFLERIDDPAKNWKFSAADIEQSTYWDAYMDAYQTMIRQTSTPHAPWHVVPANAKWYTRIVVAATIVERMASLGLHYPKLDKKKLAELAQARKGLLRKR